MIIKTFIGLKILSLTFLSGIAVAQIMKKCCDKKNKETNHTEIVPKAKKA
tara:strand:- start:117 stop:266 length:150 start_codon:yes stop_codon:yes gene_type:complete